MYWGNSHGSGNIILRYCWTLLSKKAQDLAVSVRPLLVYKLEHGICDSRPADQRTHSAERLIGVAKAHQRPSSEAFSAGSSSRPSAIVCGEQSHSAAGGGRRGAEGEKTGEYWQAAVRSRLAVRLTWIRMPFLRFFFLSDQVKGK